MFQIKLDLKIDTAGTSGVMKNITVGCKYCGN